MKFFSKIIQSALLVSTPALMAHSTNEIPRFVTYQAHPEPIRIPDLHTLSYDEVVDLLSKIESDSFEDTVSIDELDQLNQFISFLAKEGVSNDERVDMDNAIASLFRKDMFQYAYLTDSAYTAKPAIYIENAYDVVLCKNWFKKQWHATKDFVKKHKKAIIIGAIVVVTVAVVVVAAVVISSSAAGAAIASGALAGASTGAADAKNEEPKPSESLASSLQDQVSSFKETVAKEQFVAASESNGISIEENGRIIGSLFAHQTIDNLKVNCDQNYPFANELKDLGFNSQYPSEGPIRTPHVSADMAFSTDYTATYAANNYDVNMSSYQARGDLALSSGHYTQAVQDFGSAIAIDPTNPILYLERGIANFELGNYEHSISDYAHYIEKKGEPFSITDFSLGFAKGVPKGVYESGQGALLFLSDFIIHPVRTSQQVIDSLGQLVSLVKNDEFGVVAEVLSPELHQLVTQWDTLSSEARGELAGYAVGKLGADLMAPGAIAKIASKSVNSAKELVAICKNIQIAQETLVLETVTGIGNAAKIAEIVEVGKKTAMLGEELGFTAQEIGQLQKAGKLEATISKTYEHLTPSMKESFEIFDRAQKFLKPYKGFMSELHAKELIHKTGIQTFPRPPGIPANYRVKLSNNGAGIKYVHPTDEGTYIRVMPGKPHSPNPYQQQSYITYQKNGNAMDKYGNIVDKEAIGAHIPYTEFVYIE